ncbi:hypothetical protein N7541_007591 [Penicillium brevicompactum]|uniref:Uncharacterized protein n=1 Tax=Penicillium brevicompactum TaxID=5074 RepID=A0A9W9R0G2_PENBR|nr:hypothetical protein N7541_007591 [Penicillium brevicompactum]
MLWELSKGSAATSVETGYDPDHKLYETRTVGDCEVKWRRKRLEGGEKAAYLPRNDLDSATI